MGLSRLIRLGLAVVFLLAGSTQIFARPICAELNDLYQNKYIEDFALNRGAFDFWEEDRFECDGTDKNFIMARAIHDLFELQPVHSDRANYYADVSQVLQLVKGQLKYTRTLVQHPDAEARTFRDGALSAIFFTDKMIRSKERFRPTYTLVHEARHTLKGKPGIPDDPGHIVCTQGKHVGKRACDALLTKEEDLVWGSGNSHEFLFLISVRDHPAASEQIRQEIEAQLSYLTTHMFNQLEPGILQYYQVELEP
jgi:hypothetical protein